jgi:vacuolar protein sorting-associated protein VTA1
LTACENMAADIPPSLKLITSAIRRAEELDRDANPDAKIVAYYCRYYAVSKGSKLCSVPPVPAETKFLLDEMGKLEKFKATSASLTPDQGMNVCKSYAMSVFQKADDEDRAGASDKGTAKLFYAAGTFFDIMEQFGELSNEVRSMACYALSCMV